MAKLAFGPEIAADDPEAVRAWLTESQVSDDDARAMLEEGVERLFVYRGLIRSTLREALRSAMPRTMERLGEVSDECFARSLRDAGPRSRYLRDVTTEFLDFCAPLWAIDPRVPAWAMDLARHEAVQIVVASERARLPTREPGELALASAVRFIEATRLMRYDYAVHRLSDALADRTPPAAEATALFVYRSPEHEVRYLELSPLAAAILERLIAETPLESAIVGACGQLGVVLDDEGVRGTAALLADLAERGALLGALEPS